MNATLTPPERYLHAEPEERAPMAALARVLEAVGKDSARTRLLGPGGEQTELPASDFEALTAVVEAMAKGQTITLIPHHQEMTTQQAADLLHMSRPSLIKLLGAGELPYRKVGTHRRINIDDALRYRAERAEQRRRELDELTRLSEEIGYR